MSDSRSHCHVRVVLQLGALEYGIGSNEHVAADAGPLRDMHPVLQNGVAADPDRGSADDSSSVPNRGVGAHGDVAQYGCVGGYEVGLLELGLLALVGQSAQAGGQTVLVQGLALDFTSDFVETLACGSEGWAEEVLGEVAQKFVENYSHQLIIIMV